MADNVAWARKLNSDYRAFADPVIRNSPQAETFARSEAQNGRFDYQRSPGRTCS